MIIFVILVFVCETVAGGERDPPQTVFLTIIIYLFRVFFGRENDNVRCW